MNNIPKDNIISDESLMRLFDAKEAGKSFPDALLSSGVPADTVDIAELRTLWDMHGTLVRESHNISLDSRVLTRALDTLPLATAPTVTSAPALGYYSETKNAPSDPGHISNNLHAIMQMNWKLGAPIAVLVIAVVAVMNTGGNVGVEAPVTMDDMPTLMQAPSANTELSQESTLADSAMMSMTMSEGVSENQVVARSMKSAPEITAPVTGEVDDLVTALVFEATGDNTLLDDAAFDIALITSDSQSINDFNTTYDETTF